MVNLRSGTSLAALTLQAPGALLSPLSTHLGELLALINEAFGFGKHTLGRIMLLKLMVKEGRCCGEKRGLIIECLASAELTSDRSCPTVLKSRDMRCHNGTSNVNSVYARRGL